VDKCNGENVTIVHYSHSCEPTFITEVLGRVNTDMLLDIAHAGVSASRFGRDIKDYLAELPMECVKQLHISGEDKTLRDAHEPLQTEDYKLLECNKDEKSLLEHLY
jgi:uncharacterized protein